MITKFANSIIICRAMMMRYVLLTGYLAWDKNKLRYISAPNYMIWNSSRLLFSLGLYPILLSVHLVNKCLTENIFDQPGKVLSYTIGWAENIFSLLALANGIWFKTQRNLYQYLLNQLFTYDIAMTTIRGRNDQRHKHLKDADQILLLLFVTILVLPHSFVCILTVNADETHNLIEEWLEIDLKWNSEHAYVIIGLIWGASNAASVVFFGLVLPLLYTLNLIANLEYLMPTDVFIHRRSDHTGGQICYFVRTKGFGVLSEEEYIRILRTEGVMNRMFTGIYKTTCISAHHLCCLVIFVVAAFLVIQQGDILVQEGLLIVLILFAGVTVPIFIEYVECTRVGQLSDCSKMLLKMTTKLTPRKTVLHKFATSCEVLRMHSGYPFYNVDRHTFFEFMDEAANALFNLLATY